MHTSRLLTSGDFACRRLAPGGAAPADFAALFPDFHERDRVAVVSPRLEDGVLGAGASLLALATAFYDVQRARGGAFFDYPRHLALLGGENGAAAVDAPTLRASWGQLDVWPETNWIVVAPTAEAMLERVYALHVDRLFWPESWAPGGASPRLPALARRLIGARLKSVLIYAAAPAGFALAASPRAMTVLERSAAALPGAPARANEDRLRAVAPAEFLASMEACFADEPASAREAV